MLIAKTTNSKPKVMLSWKITLLYECTQKKVSLILNSYHSCILVGQVFWITVLVANGFSIDLTLTCCLCRPAIRGVFTGYLPALLISAVLYIVPIIMFFLSQVEGHASISHQERTATSKVFNLLAGNLFLAVVFSGSLITISESFSKNPRDIPRRLAEAIPTQVHYPLQLNLKLWTFHLTHHLQGRLHYKGGCGCGYPPTMTMLIFIVTRCSVEILVIVVDIVGSVF